MNKSNPKLSSLISKLWQNVQADAKSYQDQSIIHKLDEMIELTTQKKIRETADYWQIGEDELQFVVDNYRIGRDKQNGEKAITESQDYLAYKEAHGDKGTAKTQIQKSPQRGLYAHDLRGYPTAKGEIGLYSSKISSNHVNVALPYICD